MSPKPSESEEKLQAILTDPTTKWVNFDPSATSLGLFAFIYSAEHQVLLLVIKGRSSSRYTVAKGRNVTPETAASTFVSLPERVRGARVVTKEALSEAFASTTLQVVLIRPSTGGTSGVLEPLLPAPYPELPMEAPSKK